jgi:uncharacterized protein YvpB
MRDAVTKTTQAGEADPDFDEAKNAGNGMKLVRAWNEMVEMTFNIHNWFFDNIDLYEKYIGDHTGRKVCSITQSINTFNI